MWHVNHFHKILILNKINITIYVEKIMWGVFVVDDLGPMDCC